MSNSNNKLNYQSKKGSLSEIFNIEKHELKKFVPLVLMAIFVAYVNQVLRASKDAMVIPVLGAEIISSMKLWTVLPASVLFLLAYSKIIDLLSKAKVFYIIVGFFLSFFTLFAFWIYPNHDSFTIDLSNLISQYPSMKWPILMVSNWSLTIFYVMCEICGNVSMFILFWQLANEINNIKEAKKYYALFILATNVGQVFSGLSVKYVSSHFIGNWELAVQTLMSCVVMSLILIAIIYNWISKNITINYQPSQTSKKKKMTLMQSLKVILSSKYIGFIAMMIICYSISLNILEGIWKSHIRLEYPTSDQYNAFLGQYQVIAGFSYMFMVILSAWLVRKYSWLLCSIITPIMVLVTGAIFFALTIFDEEMTNIAAYASISVTFAAVIVGTLQNILSKGMKYSIFDITKEISYIPLDEDLKTKGKAAADLIGHKLGKSGGAFIQWALLSLMPGSNLLDLSGYFLGIFIIAIILWIWAAVGLNIEFLKKSKGQF